MRALLVRLECRRELPRRFRVIRFAAQRALVELDRTCGLSLFHLPIGAVRVTARGIRETLVLGLEREDPLLPALLEVPERRDALHGGLRHEELGEPTDVVLRVVLLEVLAHQRAIEQATVFVLGVVEVVDESPPEGIVDAVVIDLAAHHVFDRVRRLPAQILDERIQTPGNDEIPGEFPIAEELRALEEAGHPFVEPRRHRTAAGERRELVARLVEERVEHSREPTIAAVARVVRHDVRAVPVTCGPFDRLIAESLVLLGIFEDQNVRGRNRLTLRLVLVEDPVEAVHLLHRGRGRLQHAIAGVRLDAVVLGVELPRLVPLAVLRIVLGDPLGRHAGQGIYAAGLVLDREFVPAFFRDARETRGEVWVLGIRRQRLDEHRARGVPREVIHLLVREPEESTDVLSTQCIVPLAQRIGLECVGGEPTLRLHEP